MEEQKSEFGKGFVYNLFLFAKHWWKHFDCIEDSREHGYDFGMWKCGASDHMEEFEIPPQFVGTEIGDLAEEVSTTIGKLRFSTDVTKEQFDDIFKKLERLCMLIDKHLGVEPVEARWT